VKESVASTTSRRTGVAGRLWSDFQTEVASIVAGWGQLSIDCFEGRGVGTHPLVTVSLVREVFEAVGVDL
jgi:hypothetical protein